MRFSIPSTARASAGTKAPVPFALDAIYVERRRVNLHCEDSYVEHSDQDDSDFAIGSVVETAQIKTIPGS